MERKFMEIENVKGFKMEREVKTNINENGIGISSTPICRMEFVPDMFVSENDAKEILNAKKVRLVYEIDDCKKEILDDEEKKYLREVIRPFRDRVDYIEKNQLNPFDDNDCYIEISIDDEEDCVSLPNFDADDMYLGMEIDREYTLEELGL